MFLEGVPNLVAGWHWLVNVISNFAVRLWPLPARGRVHRDGTACELRDGYKLFELQTSGNDMASRSGTLSHKRLGQVSRLLKRRRLHGFIKKVARTYRLLPGANATICSAASERLNAPRARVSNSR